MNRRIFLLCLGLFLALPPFVFAGVVTLPQTGQTSCSDEVGKYLSCPGSGQDGDIRAGISWPKPRFSAVADGTVTDELTGLSWGADANAISTRDPQFDAGGNRDGRVSWQRALDYVAKLNKENYLGHNDWRLPNVNELASLLNAEETASGWLNRMGFTNVQSAGYWSSTGVAANKGDAWAVDFGEGTTFAAHKEAADSKPAQYVWPVRGTSRFLPATGSVTSLAAGDDGAMKAGVAWPTNRFTGKGSTLSDNLTGLIWMKDANAPGPKACGPNRGKIWVQAFAYVKCINKARYLGHDDWRVPNRNEMRSLLDFGSASVVAPLRKSGFINVQTEKYWTSTSAANAYAWFLDMGEGDVDYRLKRSTFFVWPVRGGWGTEVGKYDLTTTLSGSGAVRVDSKKGSTVCSAGMASCTFPFEPSTAVNLLATPADGFVFTGWSGACSGTSNKCAVTMDGPVGVSATFVPAPARGGKGR